MRTMVCTIRVMLINARIEWRQVEALPFTSCSFYYNHLLPAAFSTTTCRFSLVSTCFPLLFTRFRLLSTCFLHASACFPLSLTRFPLVSTHFRIFQSTAGQKVCTVLVGVQKYGSAAGYRKKMMAAYLNWPPKILAQSQLFRLMFICQKIK